MTGVDSTDISSRPKAAKRATARGVAGRSIVGDRSEGSCERRFSRKAGVVETRKAGDAELTRSTRDGPAHAATRKLLGGSRRHLKARMGEKRSRRRER